MIDASRLASRTMAAAASSSAPGAWSPPIASNAIRLRLRLLLFLRNQHDLLSLVRPALHADAVRRLGLAALGAGVDVRHLDARHPLGAAPRRAPERLSTLLNRHRRSSFSIEFHVT